MSWPMPKSRPQLILLAQMYATEILAEGAALPLSPAPRREAAPS